MRGERIFRTFFLTLVGLALFGMFRPSSPDPLDDASSRQTWFFINKTHQDSKFDGIVIGDSRALRAVSAQTLGDSLGGLEIFNFAFKAGGFNREIFLEAEKLLDGNSPNPTLVLAPTALSFLPRKAGNDQFHEYRDKPRDQIWLYMHFPGLANWFQPVSPSIFLRKALGIRPTILLEQDFSPDGWIATDQIPPDDMSDLSIYQRPLVGEKADPAIISEFMDQTREWGDLGIKVFGFFPPAYEPRVAQEDSMLGFDRSAFIKSFRSAGGIWLDIAPDGYQAYDGSHLESAAAQKLSRDLSREMKPYF